MLYATRQKPREELQVGPNFSLFCSSFLLACFLPSFWLATRRGNYFVSDGRRQLRVIASLSPQGRKFGREEREDLTLRAA